MKRTIIECDVCHLEIEDGAPSYRVRVDISLNNDPNPAHDGDVTHDVKDACRKCKDLFDVVCDRFVCGRMGSD